MVGLILGIFLVLMCILMLNFGSGDILGFISVIFVMIIGLCLIFNELKKRKKDKKTAKHGEECYARVLSCEETGTFFLDKKEYKVIVAVYVKSLQKRLILEEIIGFNKEDEYLSDSYLMVLYHKGDINVKEKINEVSIPNDILDILKDESVLKEYQEYQERIAENIENIKNGVERAAGKTITVIDRAQLIIKRILLAPIIIILLLIILFETIFIKQTIKASGYIETIAKYSYIKDYTDEASEEDNMYNDYIYTFIDKKGNQQEITISESKDNSPKEEITIKYDENNPQEFYEEGMIYNKSQIIWYIVKLVALVLLIILFFNKKLLSKIYISGGTNITND